MLRVRRGGPKVDCLERFNLICLFLGVVHRCYLGPMRAPPARSTLGRSRRLSREQATPQFCHSFSLDQKRGVLPFRQASAEWLLCTALPGSTLCCRGCGPHQLARLWQQLLWRSPFVVWHFSRCLLPTWSFARNPWPAATKALLRRVTIFPPTSTPNRQSSTCTTLCPQRRLCGRLIRSFRTRPRETHASIARSTGRLLRIWLSRHPRLKRTSTRTSTTSVDLIQSRPRTRATGAAASTSRLSAKPLLTAMTFPRSTVMAPAHPSGRSGAHRTPPRTWTGLAADHEHH